MTSFIFKDKTYVYFNHEYNKTWLNERCVEIPISLEALNMLKENVLEVGCVLPYYIDHINHEVIDLADDHVKSKKIDATTVSFKDKNVISISTLEHIGVADYNLEAKEQDSAWRLCERIINESSKYFITWPIGSNKGLDDWAFNRKDLLFMSRDSVDKYTWVEKKFEDLNEEDKTYGTFICANSIAILTNI